MDRVRAVLEGRGRDRAAPRGSGTTAERTAAGSVRQGAAAASRGRRCVGAAMRGGGIEGLRDGRCCHTQVRRRGGATRFGAAMRECGVKRTQEESTQLCVGGAKETQGRSAQPGAGAASRGSERVRRSRAQGKRRGLSKGDSSRTKETQRARRNGGCVPREQTRGAASGQTPDSW